MKRSSFISFVENQNKTGIDTPLVRLHYHHDRVQKLILLFCGSYLIVNETSNFRPAFTKLGDSRSKDRDCVLFERKSGELGRG